MGVASFCTFLASHALFFIIGLFQSLLAQHGDDFKQIAASMPNKVCLVASAS